MSAPLELPDELMRRVRSRAEREGRAAEELVAEYVETGLAGAALPARPLGAPIRSAPPIARRAAANGTRIPALTNAEAAAILDEEDAAGHLRLAGR